MRRVWRWLRAALARLRALAVGRRGADAARVPPPDLYRAVRVEERPDAPARGDCYLVGEGEHVWCVSFLCPCGCGAEVALNLLPQLCPRWEVQVHADQTVTLRPSIHRVVGCESHFFVRRGRVLWCEPGRGGPYSSHAG